MYTTAGNKSNVKTKCIPPIITNKIGDLKRSFPSCPKLPAQSKVTLNRLLRTTSNDYFLILCQDNKLYEYHLQF